MTPHYRETNKFKLLSRYQLLPLKLLKPRMLNLLPSDWSKPMMFNKPL